MAGISLNTITGVGTGILTPKMLSRFNVVFYVQGTKLGTRAEEMNALTNQIIRADCSQPLNFYSHGVVNNDRLQFVFEDDITNLALRAAIKAGYAAKKFDVVVEQLDGNDKVLDRMCYYDAFFTELRNNASYDYAAKLGNSKITVDINSPIIEGASSPLLDTLHTFVKSLNVRVTTPNDNVDLCVTKTVEMAYSKMEIRF